MLCQSCDAERRRLFDEAKQSNEAKATKTRSTGKPPGSSNAPIAMSTSGASDTAVNVAAPTATTATSAATTTIPHASNMPLTTTNQRSEVKTIINELLMYVVFYRDRCTPAEMHKLIAHFYLPSEISTSKATVMNAFEIYLSGCQYTTARRQTTTRPAHEAEIEDVLGMLDLLDNLKVLESIQFAAVAMDRLPKYGPNEINICTVVDRQIQIDQELTQLKSALHETAAINSSSSAQMANAHDTVVDALHTRFTAATDMFHGQLQQLEAICKNIQVMTSAATNNAIQSRTSTLTPTDDRASNIIVFGLAEDRNSSVWNSALSNVLHHVAGRPVELADAFRIGKYDANQVRPRPVIVKLRSVWDRRLLLSNARKLAETSEFRRIGFAPDEPLEIRRKNTMKRLHYKATQEGKHVLISDDGDCFYVNDVPVFSLNEGFIRSNANASNSSRTIHG
jgi:hypothetical protein